MIRALRALYGVHYPAVLVYMLQSTEYKVGPYIAWYWRTQDFSRVMTRRTLHRTKAASLLIIALWLGILLQLVAGVVMLFLWHDHHFDGGWAFGLALLISYPVVWAHLVAVPLAFGRTFIIAPRERKLIADSERIFAEHPGIKIAVAGSYGKTSMKELLLTILSEGKRVAATPANKNVALSHAKFATTLQGDEEVLIIEYGEGGPGDVARFAHTTHPTHAVITGLAPAHLDQYKTLTAAGEDIFSVATYLKSKNVYVNGESSDAKAFIRKEYYAYSVEGVSGWSTHDIVVAARGVEFSLTKGKRTLHLKSGLLGEHQVGPLAVGAILALELGLTEDEVIRGVSRTVPFEHRMQPYSLNGALVIDDTYNGNLEGIRVGTALLAALPALRRKWYVSPGLVDQGVEAERVHQAMGEYIGKAHPDVVVLMQNSATMALRTGLESVHFSGELRIEESPLMFYENLGQFVAAGDIVLLQNDWTDNYH